MAHIAVVRAQHRRGGCGRGQGRGLRRCHQHRIRVSLGGPVLALIAWAVFARLARRTIIAGPIVTGPFITGAVITLAVITLAFVAGTIIALAVIAGALVPWPFIAGPVIALTIIAGPIILIPVFTGPVVVPPAVLSLRSLAAGLTGVLRRGFGFGLVFHRFAAALVFEVDVVAGYELVATDDVGQGPQRLHGAKQAEVMLGMLLMIFRQHPVAGGGGVSRQLLVFLIDVLRRAADFDALRTVGIKGAIGVVLWLAAATAGAGPAIAVAPTLALHSFEISHML